MREHEDDSTPAPASPVDRRTALSRISTLLAGVGAWPVLSRATKSQQKMSDLRRIPTKNRMRKIATEEAFLIPEVAAAMREVVGRGGPSLDEWPAEP